MKLKKIEADVLAAPAADLLLLTVFFLVMSGNLLYRSAIPVRLPAAAPEILASEDNPVVTLTKGEGIFLNGRKVSEEGLFVILELTVQLAERRNREPTLIISADRAVSHEFIMETINWARKAGIKNIAIATEPVR